MGATRPKAGKRGRSLSLLWRSGPLTLVCSGVESIDQRCFPIAIQVDEYGCQRDQTCHDRVLKSLHTRLIAKEFLDHFHNVWCSLY